jgi:hypothetical protein
MSTNNQIAVHRHAVERIRSHFSQHCFDLSKLEICRCGAERMRCPCRMCANAEPTWRDAGYYTAEAK